MFGDRKQCKCIVCNNKNAMVATDCSEAVVFYTCPTCGRYAFRLDSINYNNDFNYNHLSSYLAYNGFLEKMSEYIEYRYFTNRSKEWCDEWKQKYNEGEYTHGHPVFLSIENVENWYPKTFSEKIDLIMLYFGSHIKHIGENIKIEKQTLYSILFVDRFDYDNLGGKLDRDEHVMESQAEYMLDYLQKREYIEKKSLSKWFNSDESVEIKLLPEGYARIDILQKNTSNGKNVLVAMEFGDKTKLLREAIRKGITDAGYLAIFIDEVQHNDFITLELLKYIKNSRFVVVDLSDKNNGAYFEEGYAMGLGKQVIQLCRCDVNLHFDIAQKNTIMWKEEDDIPEKLKNRIIATID